MAILFPVKREMAILFFVKRDPDPPPPPLPPSYQIGKLNNAHFLQDSENHTTRHTQQTALTDTQNPYQTMPVKNYVAHSGAEESLICE